MCSVKVSAVIYNGLIFSSMFLGLQLWLLLLTIMNIIVNLKNIRLSHNHTIRINLI